MTPQHDSVAPEETESSTGQVMSRRRAAALASVLVLSAAVFAFAFMRLRLLRAQLGTPRCEIGPLESLGNDLADDDPVKRLDRVPEVVEALRHNCTAVSLETDRAAYQALGAPAMPPSQDSARWVVTGTERYGCLDQAGHHVADSPEEWRRCLELAGLPHGLVGRRSIQRSALWTTLMLQHLGVSQPAAQQLGWLLSESLWLPAADVERTLVHSPIVEGWTEVPPPRTAKVVSVGTRASDGRFSEGYVVDGDVSVAQMHHAQVVGPARFHAYSLALGPALPADVWLPLEIKWAPLDCTDQSDCGLSLSGEQAGTVAILRQGEVSREHVGGSRGHRHLLVPDRQTSWADILTAVMVIAPTDCGGTELSPGCEDPWVTLWLASR